MEDTAIRVEDAGLDILTMDVAKVGCQRDKISGMKRWRSLSDLQHEHIDPMRYESNSATGTSTQLSTMCHARCLVLKSVPPCNTPAFAL